MMEFAFETPVWEAVLGGLPAGGSLSAARFLALMEQEPESELEAALELVEKKDILLDISDLPKSASGEAVVRLRREAQLVKDKQLPQALEENDPLRLYLEEVAAIPVCGDAQLLSQEVLLGSADAAKKLTDLMLSRVIEKAMALAGNGVLLLDLIQEGSLGLWQAITTYRGGDFESYCDRSIQKNLAKTVTLQARENGVGQKLRQAMEDYRDVDQRLLTELGRNPTLEEIAREMHMTVQEAAVVAETMEAARMVNRARRENAPAQPQPEDEQAVEDTAYFQMRQRIAELLENVSQEEAELLTLRFGLEGGHPLSPEETGKRLGLTAEEVVAKEGVALQKLRG